MTHLPCRRRCCWLALFAAVSGAVAVGAEPAANTEAQARARLAAKVGFPRYVFAEDTPPAAAFENADKEKAAYGDAALHTTYYDRTGRQFDKVKQRGFVGAVVEITPTQGRATRRRLTLFRSAGKLPADWKLDATNLDELATELGVSAKLLTKQMPLLDGLQFQKRTWEQLSHDPKVARLFAGLTLSKEATPFRKTEDAYAQERQAWVTVKRHLDGADKIYDKPFVCPTPLDKAAPVVREGKREEAGMTPGSVAKLDAVLTEWAANDDQAFAVCIVRHGVLVLHKAYGQRDGQPMTVETPSWMASVTKTMSATLMMELVDRGLVSLDDPVDKFLPAFKGIQVKKPLKIRHLYTHTSGLGDWPGWDDELADVEERVAESYPYLKVGQEWKYNGLGNTLGSKIVERVTGEALPLAFQHHLYGPLGCTGTEVRGSHADAYSIPLDMAKFGQLLLNKGSYGKLRFFRAETFEQMLPRTLTIELGPDTKKRFGISLDGTPERFGHGAASAATFHVDRTKDLVVIMTRNKMGKNQDKYNGKFWDALNAGMAK